MDKIRPLPACSAPALALLAAGAAVLLAGCGAAKQAGPIAPRPSLTVTAAQAELASWPGAIDSSGSVAPWQEALIGARVSGLPLAEVLVNVGDTVKRGQLLARFDDATVRAELEQTQAALAQAHASARESAANRDRALQLKNTGALSEQSILQAVTQAQSAEAQVASASAMVSSARLKLEYTRVTAPDDGVISARTATLGAVAQGGGELFRLIRRGRLEWRAELTSTQLAQVRPGLDVKLTLPDSSMASGRVRELAPALDPNSRLGIAYVDLDPGSRARAGMYAHGRIETPTSAALTVPAESIVIHDGRSYVAALEGERVQLVGVTTGRRQAGRIEVLDHLAAGQMVAVRGAGFLGEGDVVRIASPEGAAPERVAAERAPR